MNGIGETISAGKNVGETGLIFIEQVTNGKNSG